MLPIAEGISGLEAILLVTRDVQMCEVLLVNSKGAHGSSHSPSTQQLSPVCIPKDLLAQHHPTGTQSCRRTWLKLRIHGGMGRR